MWHAAVALLGHAVQQHRSVRITWGHHTRVVEAEVTLRRFKIDELGSSKWQVMVKVKHRGPAAALVMAVSAICVEVRPSAIVK